MNVQGFFTRQLAEIYGIDTELKATEEVHLTRQGISNNDFAHTHKYKGLLIQNTVITEGDLLLVDGENFLTVAMRKIPFLNTNQANLLRCDTFCSVYRLVKKYDGNVITGKERTVILDNIPCVYKDTNSRLNDFDAGFIESTLRTLYVQDTTEIKLTDMVTVNGFDYKVDSIDKSIKGVLILRLTDDKRNG